jgi:very-short-patch-repair endonuclease
MRESSPRHARARRLRQALSLPEKLLWVRLRRREADRPVFRRQHPVGPYVLDFYCADSRLCIEVDGASHGMGERPQRDQARDAWLRAQAIDVVRLPAAYVLEDPARAADWVLHLASERKGARAASLR